MPPVTMDITVTLKAMEKPLADLSAAYAECGKRIEEQLLKALRMDAFGMRDGAVPMIYGGISDMDYAEAPPQGRRGISLAGVPRD